MNIVKRDINSISLAPYNPRKDLTSDDKEYQKIKRSIEQFGYIQPLIINKNTNIIIAGNQRYKVLKDLGFNEVDCVEVEVSEQEEKTLNLAMNKIDNEWDMEALKNLLQELDTGEMDIELTGFEDWELEQLMTQVHQDDEVEKEKYTDKIDVPQYEITGECPSIDELVNIQKAYELMESINKSSVSQKEKDFLLMAAVRHYVFDYAKIAEYYAHANEEMQGLMEESALVIIDYANAVSNGYTNLNLEISNMRGEDDEG